MHLPAGSGEVYNTTGLHLQSNPQDTEDLKYTLPNITVALFRISCSVELWAGHELVAERHHLLLHFLDESALP